jgi:hypothetical protein
LVGSCRLKTPFNNKTPLNRPLLARVALPLLQIFVEVVVVDLPDQPLVITIPI